MNSNIKTQLTECKLTDLATAELTKLGINYRMVHDTIVVKVSDFKSAKRVVSCYTDREDILVGCNGKL